MAFPHLRGATLLMLLAAASAGPAPSSRRATYTKASFVPPAAPSLVSPLKSVPSSAGWPSAVNHPSRAQRERQREQIATGYGTYSYRAASSLHAKKKKGGAQPASKKGKIRVQMLQTVPNIGQSGDVVLVSSAVFQNQLKRANKARLISDEEVQQMESEKEAQEQELKELALKTKSLLEEAMLENLGGERCDDGGEIRGVALTMRRKAGPEGNLFGGVNPKMVMEALELEFPGGSWGGRQVKLTDVKDVEGKVVKKKDIKHTGEYTCSVALGRGVDVTFVLSILAE